MRERPLSPHLSIYKFMHTMALSTLHRATGIALAVGLLLLAWWLMAAAAGPQAYDAAAAVLGSVFVKLLLAGWLVSFVYHLCNGIRHLGWDLGLGLEKHEGRAVARSSCVATVFLAALLAYLAFAGGRP
ncbi:MAG: succinate dehydrogenase, cytochrome b556 subunit [Steroidobacteraceae bacterium]